MFGAVAPENNTHRCTQPAVRDSLLRKLQETDMPCIDTKQLKRASDNAILAESIVSASSFGARFLGLMGKAELSASTAFLLDPCTSIHTCFMRFSIDIVFLDQQQVVLGVSCLVRPWRVRLAPAGTCKVIELLAGTIAEKNIQIGDQLTMEIAPCLNENRP